MNARPWINKETQMSSEIRHNRRAMLITTATGIAAAGALLAGPRAFAAESYPSKPIHLVVPYPAGGVVDLVARIVSEKMARSMGQPIVVDARPGASANIGTDAVLRAPADGYTLLMGSPYLATNPLLMQTTRWKTSDFIGLGLIGAPPNVFVVANNVPARTLEEFVGYVKARPGMVTVSNPGIGSSNHMGQELFFSITGLQMSDVMYKGQPAMIPDIAAGRVSFGLVTIALAGPQIAEGNFRALAISAPRRAPSLPDVPTLAEAGYAEATFLPWYGIVARAGTPTAIVERLSDEIMAAVADSGVVARLEKMGTQLTPKPATEFTALLASEADRWAKLIKERNIQPVG